MSSNFSFTNTETTGKTLAIPKIGPIANYAKVEDEPTSCSMKNKTCKLDQGETLSYQCTPIEKVNSKLVSQNPAKVTSGVQYIIRLDELLRTTDEQGTVICDEPVTAMLQIRHPSSGNITPEVITTVFSRLVGACYDSTKSDWRWKDLMLSALVPVED